MNAVFLIPHPNLHNWLLDISKFVSDLDLKTHLLGGANALKDDCVI
jgi:hypothetical protein